MSINAFMLPAGAGRDGQLMALWHAPLGPTRGLVLYGHPFAEEMNKTRRMAALQARALAAAGFGVLQLDLTGCGDSSGDFGDATWTDWVDDVRLGMHWLRQQATAPLTLWGLRAGCLLMAEAAARSPGETCNFLFWQPTPNGAGVLRQFLRTAAAAAALDGGGKGVVDKLRRQLAEGQPVEVSGYRLHPQMAAGLEQASMPAPAQVGQVVWLELRGQTAQMAPIAGDEALAGLSPASASPAAAWRERAHGFQAQLLAGPPFWQTTETEEAPELVKATTLLMSALAP